MSCLMRILGNDGGAVSQPGLGGHVFGEIDSDFSQRLLHRYECAVGAFVSARITKVSGGEGGIRTPDTR